MVALNRIKGVIQMEFILCTDEALKQQLLSSGFKIMKEESYGTVFVLDKCIKFNFSLADKSKYTIINKLTF